MMMQDIKINVYEMVRLFRFYYVDQLVRQQYPNVKSWESFTGKLISRSLKKLFCLYK